MLSSYVIHSGPGMNRQLDWEEKAVSLPVSKGLALKQALICERGVVGGVEEGLAFGKAFPGPEEKDLAQMHAAMLTLSGPCGSSSVPPPSYFPSPQVTFA